MAQGVPSLLHTSNITVLARIETSTLVCRSARNPERAFASSQAWRASRADSLQVSPQGFDFGLQIIQIASGASSYLRSCVGTLFSVMKRTFDLCFCGFIPLAGILFGNAQRWSLLPLALSKVLLRPLTGVLLLTRNCAQIRAKGVPSLLWS